MAKLRGGQFSMVYVCLCVYIMGHEGPGMYVYIRYVCRGWCACVCILYVCMLCLCVCAWCIALVAYCVGAMRHAILHAITCYTTLYFTMLAS